GPIRNISVVYTGIYPNSIVYVRVAASNTSTGADYNFDTPIGGAYYRFTITNIVITRTDRQPDTGGNLPSSCTFKIFKNNQVVHTETRSVCPEIEKL
ncbi:MAG: hypothetical protein RLZZ535_229, partial [Cyanobacteriota bacterium]